MTVYSSWERENSWRKDLPVNYSTNLWDSFLLSIDKNEGQCEREICWRVLWSRELLRRRYMEDKTSKEKGDIEMTKYGRGKI